jgi:hypothetical protein
LLLKPRNIKRYFGNIVQLDWATDQNADFVGNTKFIEELNSVVVPELQITIDKNTLGLIPVH